MRASYKFAFKQSAYGNAHPRAAISTMSSSSTSFLWRSPRPACQLVQCMGACGDLHVEITHGGVAKFSSTFQRARTFGSIGFEPGILSDCSSPDDLVDRMPLRLPTGRFRRTVLIQPRQLFLNCRAAAGLSMASARLLAQAAHIKSQLSNTPLHHIDLKGHGVNLDPQSACGPRQ